MALNEPPSASRTPVRRGIAPALFVVTVLLAGGAAVGITAGYFALHPDSPGSPDHPSSIALIDDLGRNVTVPYDPSRVVVLGPSIVDTMYRLGLRAHIVGVDCYLASAGGITEDYSSDQLALWHLSQSMCVTIGPTFDIESVLNRTPQLVLASTIVSVQSVEAMTNTYHIPVVMLQPPTMSGILLDVSTVGRIFGVEANATNVDDGLTVALANASARVSAYAANGTPLPSVLVTFSVDANGYWTFGPGTFGESLIELAAATSISANASLAYPELSGEQVLVDNPTYLVYATGYGQNESVYATGPFWTQLAAVQDGHAVGIDSNWLTEPDPTMVLVGLPALVAALHPGA
jgi:iron complex transport system substrate-binding protein